MAQIINHFLSMAIKARRFYPCSINKSARKFYLCNTIEWSYVGSKKLKNFILIFLIKIFHLYFNY